MSTAGRRPGASSGNRPQGSPARPSAGSSGTRPATPPGGRPTRPDPAVYRRRRLVLAAVALLVLVGLVLGVSALVGGDGGAEGDSDDAAPVAAGATTPSATPTPSPTPVPTVTVGFEPTACAPGALTVTGSSVADTYAPGAIVVFSLTLTNAGPVPCLVDGGSATVGVVVTSGQDRVWASVDCPAGRTERPLLLDAGAVENVSVAWDQVRSAPGCPAEQAAAQPGTYRAVATVDAGLTTVGGWEKVFLIQ